MTVNPLRRMGCIVTLSKPDGSTVVVHRDGKTIDALAEIVDGVESGTTVLSISTWRSVLADVRAEHRHSGANREIDAYGQERVLLGRIGRLDLLPKQADPLWSGTWPSRRRGVHKERA